MGLHLDEKEAALTFRVLRNRIEELGTEVRHNKDSEPREYLKYKKRILSDVLAKFPELDEMAHQKLFFETQKD